ncbi:hypothetical protein I601_2497 [Nocardioides dokdonensis FR1436]|uniref:Preprotein translocase subunit SecD n=1 Tax=Nocardioides dokdonensis FR1436 TaxID=1300347 RepID=A0A1A9GMT4_9ACTN|nr:hypothetical protein [Nocardioides dokdonensis]ANH38913.1 hypothetical protein I601_2497 [Nocardioides dokdonensis FR1436]
MTRTAVLVGLAALSLPLLAACAGPSHQSDAEALRDQLAALPGVSKATLDYTEPVTLDSGKLQLQVAMSKDADADQVTEVVATTYAAFADTHRAEEGDLDVRVGGDVLHLRSFEPEADVTAVQEAAVQAVAVLPGGKVRADINTQDVSKEPHVFTTFSVAVEEPGRESVLEKLATLETEHADIPDAGWRVQSGGRSGWLVSADEAFPGTEVLALFDELGDGLPDGATVRLYDDFAEVRLPADTSPEEASAVVGRHLRSLGGVQDAWYDVQSGRTLLASISDGDCFFDTGAIGKRLEQDHGAGCAEVTHP